MTWPAWVFTTELLSQVRSGGINLDRVCQHRVRQEGKTLDKTGNTKYGAQLIAEHIQTWLPTSRADPESQHEISSLKAELAKLKQRLRETPEGSEPSTSPRSAPASSLNTPIGRSLNASNPGTPPPPTFDPACLLSLSRVKRTRGSKPTCQNLWQKGHRKLDQRT